MIGEGLAKHLTEQFLHLMKSIDTSIAVYDFDITVYGNIVIFEKDNNLFDLTAIGFQNRAITTLFPEYVEVKIYDNKECYEGIVVYCYYIYCTKRSICRRNRTMIFIRNLKELAKWI